MKVINFIWKKVNGKWKMENLREVNPSAADQKSKVKKGKLKIGIIGFLIIVSPFLSLAQNSKISWSSFISGFGVSSSENTSVTSSAGIPFAGSSANGSSGIVSGFLPNYSLILTDVEDLQEEIPTVYKLNQNYPNPFNPSTVINYQIPEEGFVTLKIYNIMGEEVRTLVNQQQSAGSYNLDFDASSAPGGLASGVYIYRIKVKNSSNNFVETKKMLMIK